VLEQIVKAQEEERRRVARELHDGVSQLFGGLVLRLRLLEEAQTPEQVQDRLGELRHICAMATLEVRRLARGLHPVVLDDLGLAGALERYAAEFSSAFGIRTDVHVLALAPGRVPRPVEVALYRAIQEALTNAAKHAAARTISVVVEQRTGLVRAIVEDDGKGFDSQSLLQSSTDSEHLGLSSMRERAALLGGSVRVESRPGAGTTIDISIPLEEYRAEDSTDPGR